MMKRAPPPIRPHLPHSQNGHHPRPNRSQILDNNHKERLNEEQYKKIFTLIDLDKVNQAYDAVCTHFNTHPQREKLHLLAKGVIKTRATQEVTWINEKMMSFHLLGEIAAQTHSLFPVLILSSFCSLKRIILKSGWMRTPFIKKI